MHDAKAEGRRWLSQAENDLLFARHALDGGFFHQVCFVAQQCAEKALKAILYSSGARSVIGHSATALLARIETTHPALHGLRDYAAELDLYYIASRYPNGLVEGVPHEVFTHSQAERALVAAEKMLEAARHEIVS